MKESLSALHDSEYFSLIDVSGNKDNSNSAIRKDGFSFPLKLLQTYNFHFKKRLSVSPVFEVSAFGFVFYNFYFPASADFF